MNISMNDRAAKIFASFEEIPIKRFDLSSINITNEKLHNGSCL